MGAIQVTSSRKGAKSRTHDRKVRSTGTKWRAGVASGRGSIERLQQQLDAGTRELAEAQRHADEARRQAAQALEQQTATSEVLGVISRSPGELEPVFEAMLANATRLCGAKFGTLNLYDGEAFRIVAVHNVPSAFSAIRHEPFHPHSPSGHADTVMAQPAVPN